VVAQTTAGRNGRITRNEASISPPMNSSTSMVRARSRDSLAIRLSPLAIQHAT
jgi:hypothetical protein